MGISLSCPAQVGKWHADVNSYNHGFEYGRAVLFRPMGSTHFARAKASNESFGPLPLVDVDPGKKFRASKFKKVGQEAAVLRACTPRSRFLPRCHSSALFAEAGSRELARWRRSRLTGFLYVALTAPHDPLEPLDRDVADATAGPPASFRDRHVFSLPRVARVVAADALRPDVDAAAPSARRTGELPQLYSVHKGTVARIQPFGCFVRIDNYGDGLVHVSQLCSYRVEDPNDVVDVGQKVRNRSLHAIDATCVCPRRYTSK